MTTVLSFAHIDELLAAEGQTLGSSDWHTITQAQVDAFADATGDHQWIHVDTERAKEGPFGGTIAHGYLTLSLLPALSAEIWTLTAPVKATINYGLNKVRFPRPVPVGSRVRSTAELVEVRRGESGIRLTVRHTVEIEGGGKPAAVAETLAVVVP